MGVVIGKLAEQKQVNGLDFPVLVTAQEQPEKQDKAQFLTWVKTNKTILHDYLIKHGAVLFRGFPLESATEFEQMLNQTDYKNMPYVGGAAPREQVTQSRIVTANESPATETIPFHHEMAQVPTPPGYIYFYCEKSAKKGGATSILHSGEICQALFDINPEFARKIEEDGVRYVRVMPELTDKSSAIGRSWKDTFQVDNKEDAEVVMREAGMTWQWLENGDVKTQTKTLPAIRFDEETQQKVFFNSIVAVFTGWNDSRNKGETAVETGKGDFMDADTITKLVTKMDEMCVNFKWHEGDVLWVNNYTVLHAREPFEGERRILASISFK